MRAAPIAYRNQNDGDYLIPALTLKPQLSSDRIGFALHRSDERASGPAGLAKDTIASIDMQAYAAAELCCARLRRFPQDKPRGIRSGVFVCRTTRKRTRSPHAHLRYADDSTPPDIAEPVSGARIPPRPVGSSRATMPNQVSGVARHEVVVADFPRPGTIDSRCWYRT